MFRIESELDLTFAATATAVFAALIAGMVAWGTGAGSAMFGFVLTGLAGATLNTRRRPPILLAFTVSGSALTFLSFAAADHVMWSAIVLAAAGFLAASAAAVATEVGEASTFLVIWTVVAMLIADQDEAVPAAIGFGIGSALAAVVVMGLWRLRSIDEQRSLRPVIRLRAFRYPMLKSGAIFGAVLLGFLLFPGTPFWVALTVIIVSQPVGHRTSRRALERSAGTLLGVILGAGILVVVPDSEAWLATALVGVVFLQMLFMRANYALYATFLTAVIVIGAGLSGIGAADAGLARIGATLVGALLAVGIAWLDTLFGGGSPVDPGSPGTEEPGL